MDSKTMTKFLENLAERFGPPFLPKGFLVVTPREDGTHILAIGDREVELGREGEFTGSGTNVGPAKVWEIERIP